MRGAAETTIEEIHAEIRGGDRKTIEKSMLGLEMKKQWKKSVLRLEVAAARAADENVETIHAHISGGAGERWKKLQKEAMLR